MLKDNFYETEQKIAAACARAGRKREDVTLIAVSKTQPASLMLEAYGLGARVFGENKVQEIVDKYDALPKEARWHMIGHLQRNKVKYIIDKTELIQSVDSLRLAEVISKEAHKKGITAHILLEVNAAKEESKFGLMPEETLDAAMKIARLSNVRIEGLMTVAPYVVNQEENRSIFTCLRKLSVDIGEKKVDNVNMCILSMGMTNDYEAAIEEGATMVRIGTGLFGARNYSQV